MSPLVSVIAPVLNEAAALPGVLDHLAALDGDLEVIVADGGSRDGTVAIAREHPVGAHVVETEGGRARQSNAAAAVARGEVLVFLHADSRLPRDAHASLVRANARGGNFRIHFDGDDRFSRILGGWYAFQRRLGVYYGDSAIWARADVYRELGGMRLLPIMDDYDFVRRLEKGGDTACLPGPVVTSARRWRALGIPRTILSWWVIRALFVAGVRPERLARLYRHVR
jgi:rSAM/selenodomain-associated transferase 2